MVILPTNGSPSAPPPALQLDAASQPLSSPRSSARRGLDTGRERTLHILLVEDHLDTAAALRDLLSGLGHRVTVAHTVTDALAAASREPPELVVSDIGLPDGNGHELMRSLVQRFGLHGVAVSGYGSEEDRRRSLAAGFDSHLTKPFTAQQLCTAIAHAADASD